MILGSSCSSGASRQTNWTLHIPDLDTGPPYQPPSLPTGPVPVSRVLQLSDLHLQLNYRSDLNMQPRPQVSLSLQCGVCSGLQVSHLLSVLPSLHLPQ